MSPLLKNADLGPLTAALSAHGGPLGMWWRDDDAVAAGPALDALFQLADRFGAPLNLAVIPAALTASLPERLADRPRSTRVLVHGWAHLSHAPGGEKKAEFGDHRPVETRAAEAAAGLQRLADAFGPRLAPVFTPPWNRIAADLSGPLAAAGYRGLSTYGPRASALAAPGLVQLNTHLDPIAWRQDRSAIDPQWLIDRLTAAVLRQTETAEPIGWLTHHLDHDPAIIRLIEALLSYLHDTVTLRWYDIDEALGAGVSPGGG